MKLAARARHRAILKALEVSVCLVLIVAWSQPVSGQVPDSLSVEREAEPVSGVLGEVEFAVTLTLTGDSSQCEEKVVGRPADIILVIDHSSSMYDSAGGGASGTKMDLLKDAAKQFLTEVNLAQDLVGVVEFDTASNVAHALSDNLQSLSAAIDAIEIGSGTAIDQGIVMAHHEFTSGRARDEASHILVLLTDGHPGGLGIFHFGPSPEQAAQEAKRDGIRIITIGLGSDADQDLLKRMASQPSDFYYAPQASDLEHVYATIAATVVESVGATDILFEHTYDASSLEIVPGSIEPEGVLRGDTISWAIKELLDAPVTLSYRARPRTAGTFTIDQGDTIRYNRCGEEPRELALPPALPVSAIAPTPTPTPTPTLTPTPRPTPTPTATPPPTPLPTSTPTFGEKIQGSATSLFCDTSWWPLCLGLLLLLFLILWLLALLRELRRPATKRPPCRLIPWLVLPLALILAWLVLSRMTGMMCAGRESVYFWRISPGSRDGRIFVTDKDGLRPAQEFRALSQGFSCVGCHAVSQEGHRIAAVAGGGNGSIVVYGLDGTPVRIPELNGSYVSWSPDGTRLAVSTVERDIVVLDIAGQSVTKLEGASDPGIYEEMPAWSPDGERIAFVRGKSSHNSWTMDGPCDIYVVPAAGGTALPLEGASGTGFNYYPAYSPDGRWLAFTHHEEGKTTYSAPEAEIYIVPAGGGERIRLAANDSPSGSPIEDASNSWPTWSRTGEWLAFNSKRNDDAYDLFVTRIDANGNSGAAIPLESAANPGVFEHLPYWGEPPKVDPWPAILGLWPCLIPFQLVLLAWWLCRKLRRIPPPIVPPQPVRVPPGALPTVRLDPLWQVAPTLIIGVGGTGRWVLTHLKKALRDGGLGELPGDVRFVLLDTSEREETNVFRDHRGEAVGVAFGGESLEPHEMLLMGQNLTPMIEQSQAIADAALAGWFPYDDYRRLSEPERNLAAGTGGRRPMARAALIDRLRDGALSASKEDNNSDAVCKEDDSRDTSPKDALHLWETLTDACDKVEDHKLVRIVVVGSLAGGMSGTLSDLAYLARRAGMHTVPADGAVHLEGYFATPGAFGSVPANHTRLQINGMASGRELQRCQLSEGFPFPMSYLAAPGAEPSRDQAYLNLACDWRLFDDVTLFGGAGNPEHQAGKSAEPWATVFASMADVITLRLDRAVAAGEAGDYRAGVRSDVNAKQSHISKAVASSAGSYVYRLPLADILHIVHTMWARKLVHVFLNGDVEGSSVSFDPAEAQMPDTPAGYALKFITGRHEAGDPPRGMRTVGYLANGEQVLARDVLDLCESEERPFDRYLAHALGLILNSSGSSSTSLERRAPRLGYALGFVEAVERYLKTAAQQAQAHRESAPPGSGWRPWWKRLWINLGGGKASQAEWEIVSDRLQSWIGITSRTQESLRGVHGLLMGVEAQGDRQGVRGLYSELVARQAEAQARRNQMDQVAVRRYLWARPADPDQDPSDLANQQNLAEEWYRQAEERLPDYLDRLYWYVERDGTVRLGLIAFDEARDAIALDDRDPRSVQRLADETLRLASDVTQNWARDIGLDEALVTQISFGQNDPALRLVERIWPVASPHLQPAVDVNAQLDGRHTAASGLPPCVQGHPQLAGIARVFGGLGKPGDRFNPLLNPCVTRTIATTDRTAMVLVREHNLMPMVDLPEFRELWDAYARNAGTETEPLVEPASLSSVFAAECRALGYECRLESTKVISQDFRLLHPLLVLALARPDLAELYALAFAAGWVQVRAGTPWLSIAGQGDFELALPDRVATHGGLAPRTAGLLRIALGRAEDQDLIDRLRLAFTHPGQLTQDAWRRFIDQYRPRAVQPSQRLCKNGHAMKPGARFCGKCGSPAAEETAQSVRAEPWRPPFEDSDQAVQDLAAVAALAAYRRLAADDWDGLVMRRSRQLTI